MRGAQAYGRGTEWGLVLSFSKLCFPPFLSFASLFSVNSVNFRILIWAMEVAAFVIIFLQGALREFN